jgi:hypothetical protein
METAQTPFNFFTVSYLTRNGNISGMTLSEFLAGLEHCSDASIFHHTFQTLSIHHFLTEGFSKRFRAMGSCRHQSRRSRRATRGP